jgi:hypothetical protein
MNRWCNFWGHKPNRDAEVYRERRGTDSIERDHHFERYTTCKRCNEEVSYIRYIDVWMDRARTEKYGREWLTEENAERIVK